MDLLEYAQSLVARDNTTSQIQAYTAYLQELVQRQPNEIKVEVKSKAESNNSQIQPKSSNANFYLLIGGLGLLIASFLAIGCWLGKNKKSKN